MVNNQTEFNEKYPKETKEIKIKRQKDFQGQLIIENYLNLEKLYLREVKSIEKIILKDLPQLQECTIWECGMEELVIENCSLIKKLNVHKNLLTSLKFLVNLENLEELEELEIDHNVEIDSGIEYLPNNLRELSYENTKLTEFLKPYKGNWEECRKDIQELTRLINKIPQGLLKNVISLDNSVDFEKKYQGLKRKLASLLEIKSQELIKITTNDLMEKVEKNQKDLEEELCRLKEIEQVYQKVEEKERKLENLKNVYLERAKEEEKVKCSETLEELLEKMEHPNDSDFHKSIGKKKEKLLKKIASSSQELDGICSLRETIIKLKKGFNRHEKQIHQIIINGGYNINNIESNFYNSSSGGTIGAKELVAQISTPLK